MILSPNICSATSTNFATTSIEDISAKLYLTDCSLHQYRAKINLGIIKDIHLIIVIAILIVDIAIFTINANQELKNKQ